MSDSKKAIYEDQENYLRLCKKYGDSPELGDSRSAGKYVNPYCAHAKELQQRERDDEQTRPAVPTVFFMGERLPVPPTARGTENRRSRRTPIPEQLERRGIVERRRAPHANVIREGHRVRGEIAKALYGDGLRLGNPDHPERPSTATEMQMATDNPRVWELIHKLRECARQTADGVWHKGLELEAAAMLTDLWAMKANAEDALKLTRESGTTPEQFFQQLLDAAETARQRMLKPGVKPCVWTLEDAENNTYATGCGELFQTTDGDPWGNDFKFCFYCGGVLTAPPPDHPHPQQSRPQP